MGSIAAVGFYYDGRSKIFNSYISNFTIFLISRSYLNFKLRVSRNTLSHSSVILFKFSRTYLNSTFQISHTYLNFKLRLSRLSYPRHTHSITELCAIVPHLRQQMAYMYTYLLSFPDRWPFPTHFSELLS